MGTYDPSANPAKCAADGYFYCTIEKRCLPTTTQEAADIQKQGRGGSGGSGGSGSASGGKGCDAPVIRYEDLVGKSEHDKLMFMRTAYEAALAACTGKSPEATDSRAGFEQALTNINNGLVDIDEGIPTDAIKLFTTFYGPTMDKLDPRTRRSTPWGTVICDIDGYKDKIPVATSPAKETFQTHVKDDIKDPDFKGIVYKPSKPTAKVESKGLNRKFIDFKDDKNKDGYSEKHASCLNDLPCTYDELEHPKLDLEEDPEKGDMVDMDLSNDHITSGCANGDGLFDLLMTAVDSSIDLQFKSSRLDAKQFGEFYASVIGASLQTATSFLVQKEQLKLDAEKINLEREKYDLFLDRHKYEKQLTKLSAEKAVLEMEVLKKKLPLELALLTQQIKGAEKGVEKSARDIELTEAQVVSTYNTIGETNATNKFERERIQTTTNKMKKDIQETTLNGVLNRNLTEAKVEQTRVGIRTAKFDAILKKYQAYSTKVATEESKANGASQRRLINADVQSKNKQASLYDQQRKTYIYGQRAEVLNIMKDMWNVQIDTLGPEGMAIEAIKGPEFSSRLERAALDAGV